MPVAPATFSCFISIVLWYFLMPFKMAYIICVAILFSLGVFVSGSMAKEWGEDPRQIVIDEYASILIPLFFTPVKIIPLSITFLLFRFFDIVKPPPIKHLENIMGGWGIMLDDLLAAAYTTMIILTFKAVGLFN
jgi:phosphatidylglycerophosphatase A